MKLGILTSVETRHRYFANRLVSAFDGFAVGYEQTGYMPVTVPAEGLTPQEARIVARHFEERSRQEERYFGSQSGWVKEGGRVTACRMAPGQLNTEATLRFLESAGVDTVAVFGTNLVKSPLLERWPGRMINMHLGLSPYYRGAATNFYPLLNDEPEYVGATIHQLDAGIDSGPILRHARPTIVSDDGPHSIGCKAILAGIEAMISVLRDLGREGITPTPQWEVPHARLYLRKDYHPRQVVELYRKLDAGLIPRYVERAAVVAGRIRLVD